MERKNLYVIQVEKEHVLNQDVNKVIKAINDIELIDKNICQKIMITIDGYNDVITELYEIPEVISWVQKLFNKMPHLFYYLNPKFGFIYILASLADEIESGFEFEGELKPIQEFTEYKDIPKMNFVLTVKSEVLKRIVTGILVHGKRMKRNKQATEVANFFVDTFGKKGLIKED